MIQAIKVAVILLFCAPMYVAAQSASNELPLPPAKGVSMVVKMYYSFMPPQAGRTGFDKDTESVYLIAPDGYAYTRYICEGGLCAGKETYEYSEGKLIHRSYFNALDRHTLFVPPTAHSHRLVCEDSWEYEGGKVAVERHFAGVERTLTREIRYEYDSRGRVEAAYYEFPKQSLIYYPRAFESMQYRYSGDSVYRLAYRSGQVCDSMTYLERYDSKGLLREKSGVSADGLHFERALRRYDSSNRVLEYESLSNRPAVAPDGTVLRADRVEYTYDEKGRQDELRYFARGLKRWVYKYGYLK